MTQAAGTVEHAQTGIIQQCLSSHKLQSLASPTRRSHSSSNSNAPTAASTPSASSHESEPLLRSSVSTNSLKPVSRHNKTIFYKSTATGSGSFGSFGNNVTKSIRFQVVVWYVGAIDVIQGRVPVTFRVTMFWNSNNHENEDITSSFRSMGVPTDNESVMSSSSTRKSWEMRGRQSAVSVSRGEKTSEQEQEVQVPPVSILNVVTFDTIGDPQVVLLNEDTGLWQWSCMYRATLIQDHWRVDNFPHDCHDITLKLAVLAHRKPGSTWDREVWKLGLATENDSQGSTRIPHGLVVDQVSIPEFSYDHKEGLQFAVKPLQHGPGGGSICQEQCLQVTLPVQRDSYYYDRNIVPLLAMLNFVAITICALGADEFFQRGLLTLNIAFVEISIRMTTDKHLPSVAYPIKLQRVLNEYFFGLLFLVLESNLVYELHRYGYIRITGWIDTLAALSVFAHNAWTIYRYYADRKPPFAKETY